REQTVRRAEVRGPGHDGEQRPRRRGERRQSQPRSGREAAHGSSCACRRRKSRSGRALVTYGTCSKLCSGGGDEVYHSSVSASHGSLPARVPLRRPCAIQTFATKASTPSAITPDPIVEIKLYASHSPPWWYVQMRRGMPSSPSMCCGRNVRLKPTKRSQKQSLPSRSSSRRPKIF